MQELIKRLGFERYAENIIINFIEDFHEKFFQGDSEWTIEKNDDCNVYCSVDGRNVLVRVRAYDENRGWLTHEHLFKIQV